MGLLDWLTNDSSLFGGPMGEAGDTSSMVMPPPASAPMPPVQPTGVEVPPPPVNPAVEPIGGAQAAGGLPPPPIDPATTDIAGGMQGAGPPGAPPVPLPMARPPGAPGPAPGPMPPAAAPPPGPPMQIAPQNAPPTAPAASAIAQTALGRALGITPDQAGKMGQQMISGIGAGLKAVPENYHKAGLAAFAGSAGAAIEGSDKKEQAQKKEATDYLKAAIDAKKAGDEAGYKQNYLQYLATKLKADTDKAASKEAGSNKNDSPTQLYLSAQRLVQPERNALNKQIEQMRKDGADPAEIAKTQAAGEAAIAAKLNDHYATLGIHPQAAAAIGKQPGNSEQNPIDAGKVGITKENISKKLQPGQFFTNPADGKVYQYKGPPKSDDDKKAIPDKPTNPEPADPMKPAKPPVSVAKAKDDDDED